MRQIRNIKFNLYTKLISFDYTLNIMTFIKILIYFNFVIFKEIEKINYTINIL